MALDDVLYVRPALGKGGAPISVYKLRTMVKDAAVHYTALAQTNGFSSHGKIDDDERILPGCRFLRKYFLDELPQIYNLLKGDLSVVGVRPRDEDEWSFFPKRHVHRVLEHKPGLFGVHYAFDDLDTLSRVAAAERVYLSCLEKRPMQTKMYFFGKICYNIICRGKRSS